jgi:hypothetical protein
MQDAWPYNKLRLTLSEGPNRVGPSPPSPVEENRASFKNVGFLAVQNSGRWAEPTYPVILNFVFNSTCYLAGFCPNLLRWLSVVSELLWRNMKQWPASNIFTGNRACCCYRNKANIGWKYTYIPRVTLLLYQMYLSNCGTWCRVGIRRVSTMLR